MEIIYPTMEYKVYICLRGSDIFAEYHGTLDGEVQLHKAVVVHGMR